MGRERGFVLADSEREKNLYDPIRDKAIAYFNDNNVSWWGGNKPTGHILSSQIACLNHLFAIRDDKDDVLQLLNGVRNEFVDILPITTDKSPKYIQFEAVSGKDYLNEKTTTRGSQCTSIDALIYAKHQTGQNWLILIEWKYTEHYNDDDKAAGNKGNERKRRYNELIINSKYLNSDNLAIYYFEPFYQLMRQTLWAEQMVTNSDNETLKAENFLHIHVIPSENTDLLGKRYKLSGKNMEITWRDMLKDQHKYIIVDPRKFVGGVLNIPKYADLRTYLTERYQ